jgi:two-component system cell cycle response regulator
VRTRILIVDDSRTTIEVVKVHLMAHDYEFVTAPDGATALEIAQRSPPDVVISDLAMPGMSGLDLCKQIRVVLGNRRHPFILVTAKKDDATRRAAFAAGVDGFLTKPIDPTRLQALVSELLLIR